MTKRKLSTYLKMIKNQENLKMAKQKLPSDIKRLRGTYRQSREVKNEILTRGIPKKPVVMTKGASKFWTMLINRLSKIGSITVVDDLSLWILAESLATFMRTSKFLEENGDTYTFINHKGETSIRPRPELKILNDAWVRIYSLFRQYGLTFQARSGIVPLTPKTKSNWDFL